MTQVDFQIEAGELVGYIGPNGAGKSTTIKILSGILVPTAGHCEINGRVPVAFRRFFTLVIPLACISYFPIVGVLRIEDPLGSPVFFQWLSPIIGVGF